MSARLRMSAMALGAALLLSGCASVDFGASVDQVNADALAFTQGRLDVDRDGQQRADDAARLLDKPLGQSEAVELSLIHSAALQAMLSQSWADSATTAQQGRMSNPVFSFERMRIGPELEIGRLLSFGLFDLMTLPWRAEVANRRLAEARIRLTGEVVDHVTSVRQAWVRAVAARQKVGYARQVVEAAEASAELARRMENVGNFNKITRARHQIFYADAATQSVSAQQQAQAARETLVRLLGLTDAQASRLQLPERLPDLPKQPLDAPTVGASASQARLDVRLAAAAFQSEASAQGLGRVTTLTDIELGVRRDSIFPGNGAEHETKRGFEISLRLPLFDQGGLRRDAYNARTLAASHRLEATLRAAGSHVRQSYSAYRSAYDIARHQRDEVLPLRKLISDENVLRYNGMLIGVFELLADAREQIGGVMATLAAQEQFWLADAALQASLIGRPTSMSLSAPPASAGAAEAAH